MLCGDCCFLRGATDTITSAIFVGRLLPFNALVVFPVTSDGATDSYAVAQLADFVKATGVREMVWMSDQEGSLKNLFEAAFNHLTITN